MKNQKGSILLWVFVVIIVVIVVVGYLYYSVSGKLQKGSSQVKGDNAVSFKQTLQSNTATSTPDACAYFTIDDARANLSNVVSKKVLSLNQNANCEYDYTSTKGKTLLAAHLYIMFSGSQTDKFISSQFSDGLSGTPVNGIGDRATLQQPYAPLGIPQEAHVLFVVDNVGVYLVAVAEPGSFEQNATKAENIAKAIVARVK